MGGVSRLKSEELVFIKNSPAKVKELAKKYNISISYVYAIKNSNKLAKKLPGGKGGKIKQIKNLSGENKIEAPKKRLSVTEWLDVLLIEMKYSANSFKTLLRKNKTYNVNCSSLLNQEAETLHQLCSLYHHTIAALGKKET